MRRRLSEGAVVRAPGSSIANTTCEPRPERRAMHDA
jgi:hypothetical protein